MTDIAPVTARHLELRVIRAVNEAEKRPPYAWTKISVEDIDWLMQEHNWITSDGPGLHIDLRQANMTGIDLSGRTLRFAQFEGATMYQANLTGADLFYAHFTGTDLREVQAQGIILNMARMRGARLNRGNFAGAQIKQAWLPEADLSLANFDGADMSGTRLNDADLHESSLVGVKLTWALLQKADLRAATLTGADLRSSHMEQAELGDANLQDANLEGAWATDAACFGTDLRRTNLRGVRFQGVQLGGALLAGAQLTLTDLTNVDLRRVADRDAIVAAPIPKMTGTRTERAAALRTAADGWDRLAAALLPAGTTDIGLVNRLRQRGYAFRRAAIRADAMTSFGAFAGRVWQGIRFSIIGDGASPVRVGLWLTVVLLLGELIRLYAITQFVDFLSYQSIIISVMYTALEIVLFGLFIAAIIRRNQH